MPDPIYAIGDVHGQLDDLHRVLGLIEADGGPNANIVFVGDYVDRGPDSKGVVDLLLAAQKAGRNWTMIKGNHDRYFTRFMSDETLYDPATRPGLLWFDARLGGDKTLLSYGVQASLEARSGPIHTAALDAVPAAHIAFLKELPLMHVTEDLVFVHAGLRPGVPLEKQIESDLIWIRDPWLRDTRDHGRLVVHGHTALEHPEHYGNRVNLDGGAGYFRPLHAAVFEGRKSWLLTDQGRVPLRP